MSSHGMSDRVVEEVLHQILILVAKSLPLDVRDKVQNAGSEDELLGHLRTHRAKQAAELSAPPAPSPAAAAPTPAKRDPRKRGFDALAPQVNALVDRLREEHARGGGR
jgi:hypothetical protein